MTVHPAPRTRPSQADALEQFRALRGKYPRAAGLLDVQRGIERGYPADAIAEIAAGD